MFYVILGVVLWVIFAFWPAFVARKKGYSFLLFFAISIFISFLLSLIIVLFLRDKNQTDEDRANDAAAEAALDAEENQLG